MNIQLHFVVQATDLLKQALELKRPTKISRLSIRNRYYLYVKETETMPISQKTM